MSDPTSRGGSSGVLSSGEQRVAPSADPIRVLVVDDDPRVRAAIRETIASEAGLIITAEAPDQRSATIAARRTAPSVALVDLLLPDAATGLTLVGILSRRPDCAVVAMSVHGSLRDAAVQAGATAFVEKAGDIDGLLDAVRAASSPDGLRHSADDDHAT